MGTRLTDFEHNMIVAVELCRLTELFLASAGGAMLRMNMSLGVDEQDAYSRDLAQMMLQLRQIADGLDDYLKEFSDD